MMEKLKEVELFVVFGVVGGMLVQYLYGGARGWRVVGLIILTTAFLAFGVLVPFMDFLNDYDVLGLKDKIDQSSPLRVLFLSLTAMASEARVKILLVKVPDKFGKVLTGVAKEDIFKQ